MQHYINRLYLLTFVQRDGRPYFGTDWPLSLTRGLAATGGGFDEVSLTCDLDNDPDGLWLSSVTSDVPGLLVLVSRDSTAYPACLCLPVPNTAICDITRFYGSYHAGKITVTQ